MRTAPDKPFMNESSNRRVALNVSQNEYDICSNASYWADVVSAIKSHT